MSAKQLLKATLDGRIKWVKLMDGYVMTAGGWRFELTMDGMQALLTAHHRDCEDCTLRGRDVDRLYSYVTLPSAIKMHRDLTEYLEALKGPPQIRIFDCPTCEGKTVHHRSPIEASTWICESCMDLLIPVTVPAETFDALIVIAETQGKTPEDLVLECLEMRSPQARIQVRKMPSSS